MTNSSVKSKLVAIIACILLAESSLSYAGEDNNRISLDYGRLTPAPADPKAPEPGGVTAKYGFSIAKDFKPYVGTGLAYSIQPQDKPGDPRKIRAGVAGQAGFSYLLGGNSSLNIDYKYFNIAPDATRGDSKSAPQSIGVGIEIKF
ncbi:MAG: hypothetical protein A2X79_07610 [Desulfuromonadaceae bacterium GWB2_53_15]|nr:MAG: hypothetical protein A2X83_06035 [Desulfuromonadales bacterium GWD2_54_10]OHB25656.1 MAG: hypothetical protein A2X79_07610 [Desulfuromonadaceae bacterium GWB2_53_15]